jgi:hypothetical protein
MRCPRFRYALLATLAVLCLAGPAARADQVLGFPNGLAGWTTPNSSPNPAPGDPGTVTTAGGLTTIAESTFAVQTDLFLTFTMPSGVQSLQFTLNSVAPDSTVAENNANGYLPDAFGASLLNPRTLASLVPTVDVTTDSFYTRDVVDGVTQGEAVTGVTVTTPPGVLAVLSVDLSSLNLGGQSAEILFRLVGGTDPENSSTVTISDVIVKGGAAVPEPGTLVLGLLGSNCRFVWDEAPRAGTIRRAAAPQAGTIRIEVWDGVVQNVSNVPPEFASAPWPPYNLRCGVPYPLMERQAEPRRMIVGSPSRWSVEISQDWWDPPPHGSRGCSPCSEVEGEIRKSSERSQLRPSTILRLDASEAASRGARGEKSTERTWFLTVKAG